MPLKLMVEMFSSQDHEELLFSIYDFFIEAWVNSTDIWLRRFFHVDLLIAISFLCWSSADVFHINEHLKHVWLLLFSSKLEKIWSFFLDHIH